MAKIRLKNGITLLVDQKDKKWLLRDYELIEHVYIKCRLKKGRELDRSGRTKLYMVHRVIIGKEPAKEYVVDHINGNTLDCRRKNLRFCTRSQNRLNSVGWNRNKYKGVYLRCFPTGNFFWEVCVNRKFEGVFKSEFKEVRRYNQVARKVYGKYAWINVWRGSNWRLKEIKAKVAEAKKSQSRKGKIPRRRAGGRR